MEYERCKNNKLTCQIAFRCLKNKNYVYLNEICKKRSKVNENIFYLSLMSNLVIANKISKDSDILIFLKKLKN